MTEDLEKPLLDFDIDKEMTKLDNQYKIFLQEIQAIDNKLNRIEDKRDYEKIESMYHYCNHLEG
jgi:predicted  nucleic acid-binding Zn-ribbon protein